MANREFAAVEAKAAEREAFISGLIAAGEDEESARHYADEYPRWRWPDVLKWAQESYDDAPWEGA